MILIASSLVYFLLLNTFILHYIYTFILHLNLVHYPMQSGGQTADCRVEKLGFISQRE